MGVTIEELKDYIKAMQGMYDVVRLVEPGGCHVVNIDEEGDVVSSDLCYTVWGKGERCATCTSYQACARNRVQEKTEIKDGVECHVISIPAPVFVNGQRSTSYCIELVNFGRVLEDTGSEFVEPCANINEDALYVSIVGNKKISDDIISRALLDSDIGLICFDADNNCIYSNKQAFRLFHIPNELSKMQEFLNSWIIYDYRLNNTNVWSQFFTYDGNEHLYELEMMPAVSEDAKKIIGSCIAVMDITDEALNTGGVKFRETHDPLTGIYNQDGFFKAVRAALTDKPNEKHYIICSNIKQFKLFNQLFGMDKGDELLKAIARGLEKWCVDDDVYARTHSDEFAVLIRKDAFNMERFKEAVHEVTRNIDNSVYRLRIQLGIYEIENPKDKVPDMLDKARMAIDTLADNKELSVAFYNEEMMKTTLQENEIINKFNAALKNGEFHIFLQPQVDREGTVVGGEALARWIHPEKGIISPGIFIGVLENANLIYKMDKYVWELAAKQLSEWKGTENEKYRISVNISPKDLQFLDIGVVFPELVQKYDIDPGKLNLEITETAVAGNIGRCLEIIDDLRKQGFMVEIDDFGSGYSSLNLLKDFKVDVLKIDMKFLSSTGDQDRSNIILGHIIHMAQQLDMTVIAEGVETLDQLNMLDEMGCDMFQGYYFSKPVDIESFTAYRGTIKKAPV